MMLVSLSACAMGAKPPVSRNCESSLWLIDGKPCIKRLLDSGEIEMKCPGDQGYPEDLVGQTLKGYNCDRDYQDLLISRCKKWRK